MTAVIAITSGKANVGRSLFSSNLAHYLNRKGYRTGVLVAGSDRSHWGVEPDTTWPNIVGGRLSIDHAIQRNVFGTDLMVTRGHGHVLGNLSIQTSENLSDPLGLLDGYAYLIVDMPAGASSPTIACCLAATETIMVLTPETQSLSAGYEWLAKLARYDFRGPVNMVINQVRKPAMAQTVFARFKDLAQKKLNVQTNLWGSMALERHLTSGEDLSQPLSEVLPKSRLLEAIGIIGDRLLAEQPPENQTMPLDNFWRHFIEHLEELPDIPFTPPGPVHSEKPAVQPSIILDEIPATEDQEGIESQHHRQLHLKLEERLTAIFEELSAIRELLEKRPSSRPQGTTDVKEVEAEEISIDFDEFVRDQDDEPL